MDIAFWTCLIASSMYLLVSLALGSFHGHGDAAVGDHILHADVHPGVDGGSLHADGGHLHDGSAHSDSTGHGHDGDGGGVGIKLLAYLSPISIVGFMFGFGMAGALGRMLGQNLTMAASVALISGVVMNWVARLIVTRLFGVSTTSHVKRDEVIGAEAKVTAPIEGGRPGMVSYVLAGSRHQARAITDEEEAIPVGTMVRIRRVDQNGVRVSRFD